MVACIREPQKYPYAGPQTRLRLTVRHAVPLCTELRMSAALGEVIGIGYLGRPIGLVG